MLSVGLARGQRGNPAASLKVEQLYGIPVLLSGTAALVLKATESNLLDSHFKNKLQNLLKLHQKTPDCVVLFLAGSLPASALLHLKQLSLFAMVSRLPDNILHRIAIYNLTVLSDTSKSWFIHIKKLCVQYGLPHPLYQLQQPLSKTAAKSLYKSRVIDFWEKSLRHSASLLPSLKYFHPQFMSLTKSHPLFTTCGSNSYEVSKCITQAKFLSGRYRSDMLLRHFDPTKSGNCLVCEETVPGSLEHLLIECPALSSSRDSLFKMLSERDDISELSKALISDIFLSNDTTDIVQLLLDCSVVPAIISAQDATGNTLSEIFKFTRSWCFTIHQRRMKLAAAKQHDQ